MSNGTLSESQKKLKQELEKADKEAGSAPETDREKQRRKNFIKSYDDQPPSGSAGSTEPTTGTTGG